MIRRLLAQDILLNLTRVELSKVLLANHASVDHIAKIPADYLGMTQDQVLPIEERVTRFAELLMEHPRSTSAKYSATVQLFKRLIGTQWQNRVNQTEPLARTQVLRDQNV